MAKQSFVTGQVLTAQQVNDLQTNDFNQTVSAKTASYTLVAADKGTRITMSSTSATTITVNTGLFAAGDTLFIQNLNTGVCSITAGTATVDTSASLALAQHEGGTLYFTSAGVSTFFKAAGAAASSGGMTLINTGGTTLTGASVTIGSIPGTYKNLQLVVRNYLPSADDETICLRFNADTNTRYMYSTTNPHANEAFGETQIAFGLGQDNATSQSLIVMDIFDYANAVTWKTAKSISFTNNATTSTNFNYSERYGIYNQTGAITSILLRPNSGTFTSGTAYLYGVS